MMDYSACIRRKSGSCSCGNAVLSLAATGKPFIILNSRRTVTVWRVSLKWLLFMLQQHRRLGVHFNRGFRNRRQYGSRRSNDAVTPLARSLLAPLMSKQTAGRRLELRLLPLHINCRLRLLNENWPMLLMRSNWFLLPLLLRLERRRRSS